MTPEGPPLSEMAERSARGEAFAVATVVRRTAPSSARAGRKALVLADGTIHGWLGGACIEPTVRREALRSLADGRPRLVVFSPDASGVALSEDHGSDTEECGGTGGEKPSDGRRAPGRPGTVVHPMTCHSGGTVEVFVEPHLPAPLLELYGDSPVCRALAGMAPAAGFRVEERREPEGHTEVGPESGEAAAPAAGPWPAAGSPAAGRYAVVATLGEWDEPAVREALRSGARYVGLVASPRRAAVVRDRLGLEEDRRLVSPAGLDLGAEEPGEIAVSILAELVELRRSRAAPEETEGAGRAPAGAPGAGAPSPSLDPVCGMTVGGDRFRAEHGGRRYRFCCAGCRERFLEDPERYLSTVR